jgi:hypothetical protein
VVGDEQTAGDEGHHARGDQRAPAVERDPARLLGGQQRGGGDQHRREQAEAPHPQRAALAGEPGGRVADVRDHVQQQPGAEQHPDRAHPPAPQGHGDQEHDPQQHVEHRVQQRDDARPAAAGGAVGGLAQHLGDDGGGADGADRGIQPERGVDARQPAAGEQQRGGERGGEEREEDHVGGHREGRAAARPREPDDPDRLREDRDTERQPRPAVVRPAQRARQDRKGRGEDGQTGCEDKDHSSPNRWLRCET